jgi:hypothetical protein
MSEYGGKEENLAISERWISTINPIACHCAELDNIAQNDKLIPLTIIYSRVSKKIRVNINQNAITTCGRKQANMNAHNCKLFDCTMHCVCEFFHFSNCSATSD